MPKPGFVRAVHPDTGDIRLVPEHYLNNPGLGDWKVPPTDRAAKAAEEPATKATTPKEGGK